MSEKKPDPESAVTQALDLSLVGAAHSRFHRETGGAEGYLWNGAPCLVLTTRRRSDAGGGPQGPTRSRVSGRS